MPPLPHKSVPDSFSCISLPFASPLVKNLSPFYWCRSEGKPSASVVFVKGWCLGIVLVEFLHFFFRRCHVMSWFPGTLVLWISFPFDQVELCLDSLVPSIDLLSGASDIALDDFLCFVLLVTVDFFWFWLCLSSSFYLILGIGFEQGNCHGSVMTHFSQSIDYYPYSIIPF